VNQMQPVRGIQLLRMACALPIFEDLVDSGKFLLEISLHEELPEYWSW